MFVEALETKGAAPARASFFHILLEARRTGMGRTYNAIDADGHVLEPLWAHAMRPYAILYCDFPHLEH